MAGDNQQSDESSNEGIGESDGGGGKKLLSSLLTKEVVIPAVATAGSVVAYAARKGATQAKEKAGNQAEDLGKRGAEGAKEGLMGGSGSGLGKLASGAAGLVGGGGGGGGGGKKKTRRLPIQRWTDVAVPVETAYEAWTKFEEYPNFMHRVLNVKQEEDDKVSWDEKIWFSKRQWEGEITDRRENDRIAWKTTSGMAHAGVVSFHRLDKNLTRIMVTMDFVPQGTIEKMASGLRFVKRAVQADLARFKAYVEMSEAEELEYHVEPAERSGDEDKKDEKDEDKDEKGSGEEDASARNGDARNESDDNDRDAERKERESRRSERRETVSS